MWIVKLALSRPYTFIVAALVLLIISPVAIMKTPADIFPNINIPVVSIIWTYTGLPAHEFEGNITWPFERMRTRSVSFVAEDSGIGLSPQSGSAGRQNARCAASIAASYQRIIETPAGEGTLLV